MIIIEATIISLGIGAAFAGGFQFRKITDYFKPKQREETWNDVYRTLQPVDTFEARCYDKDCQNDICL